MGGSAGGGNDLTETDSSEKERGRPRAVLTYLERGRGQYSVNSGGADLPVEHV